MFMDYLKSFEVSPNEVPHIQIIHSKLRSKLSLTSSYFDLSKLHTHQLFKLLRYYLSPYITSHDGVFLHCSAVRIEDNSIALFVGDSGAGKSTISQYLDLHYPKVADDIVILRKQNSKIMMYSTPFLETHKSANYAFGLPVESLFFLKKSTLFRRRKITETDSVIELLHRQMWVLEGYTKQQLLLLGIIAKTPSYYLYFPKEELTVRLGFSRLMK